MTTTQSKEGFIEVDYPANNQFLYSLWLVARYCEKALELNDNLPRCASCGDTDNVVSNASGRIPLCKRCRTEAENPKM
jgi:hypothetical protein